MLKRVIRLTRPGHFQADFVLECLPEDAVIVRPRFLSICAADQRYFRGQRPPAVLHAKLPMALLHEATGEVLHDPKKQFATAEQVVLIPCAVEASSGRWENYCENASFHSSTCDGFAQEFLALPRRQLLPLPERDEKAWVFAELCSVSIQAVRRWLTLKRESGRGKETGQERIGIWGDGCMGYTLGLTLRHMLPDAHIAIIGKHQDKLGLFSFADETVLLSSTAKPQVDHAFECVGGEGAATALEDIITHIHPLGSVILFGVSEIAPPINTRLLLEKGLLFLGCSRSAPEDFHLALDMLGRPKIKHALRKIISHETTITDPDTLRKSFLEDQQAPYKTVLEWNI